MKFDMNKDLKWKLIDICLHIAVSTILILMMLLVVQVYEDDGQTIKHCSALECILNGNEVR